MQVVWRLRTTPDGELSVGVLDGNGRVLLDREMRIALIEECILKNFVGFREAQLDVSEFKSNTLVDVSFFAVVVNARFGSDKSFLGTGDRRQNFVVDSDQVQRLESGELFASDDCSDRIADVPHMIDA
jgi:hypothetical protein